MSLLVSFDAKFTVQQKVGSETVQNNSVYHTVGG